MKRLLTICAVAAIVLALANTAMADLVSYWPFDEGTGTIASDSIGTNHGTVVGALWTTGAIDGALQFGQSQPDRVIVLDSDTLEPSAVSVAAWVKSNGSPGGYRYIVAKYYTGGYASYGLYTGSGGGLYFYVSNSAYALSPGLPAAFWDNNWHHIVGTYDGSDLRLYVDGSEVGSGTACTKIIGYNNGNLYIGSYGTGYFFDNDGFIDEVAIWNHALTAEEVTDVYINGVVPPEVICTTIQDGTLVDTEGNPISTGYDKWGYNYQAHMFNGLYWNTSRPEPPWTEEDLIAEGKSTTWLVMKWNDAWLSNKDCDGDGLLDRHLGYDTYRGSGAWLTNHQTGFDTMLNDKGKTKTVHWNYFVKMVSAPSDAYTALNDEGVLMYYGADDIEIGSVIWGQHARIQQVYNDPLEGVHGKMYLSPTSPGFGYYQP